MTCIWQNALTSATVISRGYHAAPDEAGQDPVNRRAGPHGAAILEPHPAALAYACGAMIVEETVFAPGGTFEDEKDNGGPKDVG